MYIPSPSMTATMSMLINTSGVLCSLKDLKYRSRPFLLIWEASSLVFSSSAFFIYTSAILCNACSMKNNTICKMPLVTFDAWKLQRYTHYYCASRRTSSVSCQINDHNLYLKLYRKIVSFTHTNHRSTTYRSIYLITGPANLLVNMCANLGISTHFWTQTNSRSCIKRDSNSDCNFALVSPHLSHMELLLRSPARSALCAPSPAYSFCTPVCVVLPLSSALPNHTVL